ncbi:malate dehydrogenase (oxaloacetate-decarboxylating) [Bathymodiolus platifrons methanotrophic gill symbiont]|uniref:NAD-dependent malic enzyme n=1 Tax=Bathymodiolus platifrons methanotrophic gill symbiont TaxID=113268 RepID=UPI001B6A7C7F|nr:NAD-dependent malic enzyme [Bathymodiolus platifrons methanotrophic gill symbiont]GFO74178.1 malate dehydrogenase (oxaloacetate-decarboxylating) [Bathymodiolus platifrons methanotrophic gill symbiont]
MQMTKKRPLYTSYTGSILLETALLNKGSAFTASERQEFNLDGLLPTAVESIEEQGERAYHQFSHLRNDLNKHIFLRNIQDTNETLYFNLLTRHLEEMMPIIYTPTVGLACQQFSRIYRRKRGLFISYPDREKMADMLKNLVKENVKVIVVTDSERILGLGDQGIGGMGIPIGKLALYSGCGGISPAYTLPITLDVGTNNQELLDDPMYMGWRHKRVTGEDYFNFIDLFIQGLKQRWPDALVQFEDFSQNTATPLLKKYQHKLCCFNDDIQGTAAVTVGTLLAACHANNTSIIDQRIVFIGGGSAGCGIAEQIVAHMIKDGLTEEQALSRIYLFTHLGLLTTDMDPLLDFQEKFAKDPDEVSSWNNDGEAVNLLDIVRESKPTILIGVSGQSGLMTETIIKTMSANCKRPIILPLSNPTSHVEALPEDIINWTEGNAIIATGSPFSPVEYGGKHHVIAQCNNSYIFPGVGLGVITSQATRVTEKMFMVASETLAEYSPLVKGTDTNLLPALSQIREVSLSIALAVGMQAIAEGFTPATSKENLEKNIQANFWTPEYRDYRRKL